MHAFGVSLETGPSLLCPFSVPLVPASVSHPFPSAPPTRSPPLPVTSSRLLPVERHLAMSWQLRWQSCPGASSIRPRPGYGRETTACGKPSGEPENQMRGGAQGRSHLARRGRDGGGEGRCKAKAGGGGGGGAYREVSNETIPPFSRVCVPAPTRWADSPCTLSSGEPWMFFLMLPRPRKLAIKLCMLLRWTGYSRTRSAM